MLEFVLEAVQIPFLPPPSIVATMGSWEEFLLYSDCSYPHSKLPLPERTLFL